MMLASRGQPREDEAPVSEASIEDLDSDMVTAYPRRRRMDEGSPFRAFSDSEVLRITRVLVPHEECLVPSLAGILAMGRYPQRFFPSLEMTVVVYPTVGIGVPGPGGERFLDNRRVMGPIPSMVLNAMDILKRNMARRSVVRGLFREDMWEYPEEALREALVNALVHRDYSPAARSTPVQIQMFPDRLTILNPGGLFGPVTVDQLGEIGISAARNQTLLKILEDLPVSGGNRTLCENRSSGIGAMLASLRRASMTPPVFDNGIAFFRVTFPSYTLLDQETLDWLGNLAPQLSDTKRLALAFLHQKGRITNQEYRRLTGQDSREVSRDLRRMVEDGLLEQVETGRWAVYRLATLSLRTAQAPAEDSHRRRSNKEEEVLAMLADGKEYPRREIAHRLGWSETGTAKVLGQMMHTGVIERTAPARSKYTRYRLRPPQA